MDPVTSLKRARSDDQLTERPTKRARIDAAVQELRETLSAPGPSRETLKHKVTRLEAKLEKVQQLLPVIFGDTLGKSLEEQLLDGIRESMDLSDILFALNKSQSMRNVCTRIPWNTLSDDQKTHFWDSFFETIPVDYIEDLLEDVPKGIFPLPIATHTELSIHLHEHLRPFFEEVLITEIGKGAFAYLVPPNSDPHPHFLKGLQVPKGFLDIVEEVLGYWYNDAPLPDFLGAYQLASFFPSLAPFQKLKEDLAAAWKKEHPTEDVLNSLADVYPFKDFYYYQGPYMCSDIAKKDLPIFKEYVRFLDGNRFLVVAKKKVEGIDWFNIEGIVLNEQNKIPGFTLEELQAFFAIHLFGLFKHYPTSTLVRVLLLCDFLGITHDLRSEIEKFVLERPEDAWEGLLRYTSLLPADHKMHSNMTARFWTKVMNSSTQTEELDRLKALGPLVPASYTGFLEPPQFSRLATYFGPYLTSLEIDNWNSQEVPLFTSLQELKLNRVESFDFVDFFQLSSLRTVTLQFGSYCLGELNFPGQVPAWTSLSVTGAFIPNPFWQVLPRFTSLQVLDLKYSFTYERESLWQCLPKNLESLSIELDSLEPRNYDFSQLHQLKVLSIKAESGLGDAVWSSLLTLLDKLTEFRYSGKITDARRQALEAKKRPDLSIQIN